MTTDETLVFAAMRAARPQVTETAEGVATVTSITKHTEPDIDTPASPVVVLRPSRTRRTVAVALAAAAVVVGAVTTANLVRPDVVPMTPAEREQLAVWCVQAPYVSSLASSDPADVRIYYTDRLGYALTSSQTAPEAIARDASVLAEDYRRIHDALAASQWQLDSVDVDLSADAQDAAGAIDEFRAAACPATALP